MIATKKTYDVKLSMSRNLTNEEIENLHDFVYEEYSIDLWLHVVNWHHESISSVNACDIECHEMAINVNSALTKKLTEIGVIVNE